MAVLVHDLAPALRGQEESAEKGMPLQIGS